MFPLNALSYVNSSIGYLLHNKSTEDFQKSSSVWIHDDGDLTGDDHLNSESEFELEKSSWYGLEWLRRRRSPLKANNLLMIEGEPLSREILDRYLNDQTKIYDENVYDRRQRLSEDMDCCDVCDSLDSCNTTVDLCLNDTACSGHCFCEHYEKESCSRTVSSSAWNHVDLDQLQAVNDQYDQDHYLYYGSSTATGTVPLMSLNSWGGKYKFQIEILQNGATVQESTDTSVSSFRLYKWRLDLKMISNK
mmetsp:Transcript_8442/g.28327  ORF Transcript_8442/g.28327 Transcript_8442/m.28327 type:complete len:248 (-) Transcript_8442:162-905(-)